MEKREKSKYEIPKCLAQERPRLIARRGKYKYEIPKWLGQEERRLIEEVRELCQRRHGIRVKE